ncbi:MAG: molecular chaperone TorD family protein [Desulfobacterales bacterium]|nr:molecular chaperone TorD family protein [Desulfobacterales bacterium]
MTAQEKEYFCQLLASLFYPPDQELAKQIYKGDVHSFFEKYVQSSDRDGDLIKGFLMEGDSETVYRNLKEAYERLFWGVSGEGIPLVESFYKPWTRDPYCTLPFASERGLLMGDSALHLSAIYQQCGLEVADEFKGRPDHIVTELEFLSYLYRWASDREVKRLIEDHLDWIPLLKEEFKKFHPHPFYSTSLEVLDLFLSMEKKRLEMENDGKKSIH